MENAIDPERGGGGEYAVDAMQDAAIETCIAYLGKYMKT